MVNKDLENVIDDRVRIVMPHNDDCRVQCC